MESRNHKTPQWGLGLRPHHFSDLKRKSTLPLLEIMADNLIGHRGGPGLFHTDQLAERASVLMHGVGLNLGGESPHDERYLRELRVLVERYRPLVVSDHLCFTRSRGASSFELLPIPFTHQFLSKISDRISRVQDFLGQTIAVENITSYIAFKEPDYSEGEFMTALTKNTGCDVLLDTNNLFVNSVNFGFDPLKELMAYPLHSVRQIHVAGHTLVQEPSFNCLFDTHDQPVCSSVIALTRTLLSELPDTCIPLVLEWDDHEAPMSVLDEELVRIQELLLPSVQAPR